MATLLHTHGTGLARAAARGGFRGLLVVIALGVALAVAAQLPQRVEFRPPPDRPQSWEKLCPRHRDASQAVVSQRGQARVVPFGVAWEIYRGRAPGVFLGSCASS